LGTYTDITTLKNTQNELLKQKNIVHHQAHYDELTGLPNRALFQNKLKERISKIQNTKNKIALLFMDLDNFKAINDSFGHHIGDEVLKIVTQRLTNAIKTQGSISRLGGDEFAIILDTLEEEQNISLISNTLLKSLAEPIHLHGNTLYASSSIGISVYPEDTLSMQDLIKFADSAMYKAKDEGKNNFQYYNPKLTELAFERVMMESSLKSALQNSEFVVYYQPQINALSREIIGMEALVRWNHPAMGIVPPSKFIPLAQTTGLIVELDRYVMKTAMTQLSQWYKKGLSPGMLAMNLSVKQLQQEDFLEFLQELIVSTQCDPHWLELEVTEDQIMQHPERAISLLQAISDIGLELAVDDFGTGYSSLAYLKRLPIDKLKIDQMFIRELPYNEEDASITQAVIALAKSLKLKVIAEGVETQEQCNFVIENGCQNIQGYFFSRPLPALEFEKLLK
jgi:diguanylate cyclase (GGDEF)-like protein